MGKLIKKIIIGILSVFVIVCVIGIVFGNKQDFHLVKDTLSLEYGETLPEQFDDFIDTDGDIANIECSSQDIDDFKDILEVGNYTIDFQLGDKKETLHVSVEDTTSPQLQL